MKTSINDPCPARAAGNGSLLLVCGTDGTLSFSRYGAAVLTLRPTKGGAYCESRREGDALVLRYYGLPPAPDPTISRSAVTVTVTCHERKPLITLDILAAHDLTVALTPAHDIRFGRTGESCFRTSFGLQGSPEGQMSFFEDEATLTFSTGYSRLRVRLENEQTAYRRPWERKDYFRRFPHGPEEQDATRTELREEIFARQSAEGGFCLAENCTSMEAQCGVVDFLVSEGNRLPCDAFFRYAASLLEACGHLPYAATADGKETVSSLSDGTTETALLLTMRTYVRRFGLSGNGDLPALAGKLAEALLTVYRGKPLPHRGRDALAFSLSICRRGAARGRRFRIASALDHAVMTEETVLSASFPSAPRSTAPSPPPRRL